MLWCTNCTNCNPLVNWYFFQNKGTRGLHSVLLRFAALTSIPVGGWQRRLWWRNRWSKRRRWRRRRRRRWRWAGPRDTFNLIRGEEEQSQFCQKRCCQAFLPKLFWIPKYILSSEDCGTCLRSHTPLCPPRSSLSSRSPSSSSPRSACASTPCHLYSGIILTR